MGHSSRKKKKSGISRKNKGKASSKDNYSQLGEENERLSEELTSLASIYQEDMEVVSAAIPTQLSINLRPYPTDMSTGEVSLSALLLVRFLPGYPDKCPKLQIVPEKGLSTKDADRLLSLLVDQANIDSREGRVMIYNLTEAAKEYLSQIASQIAPVEQPFDSVSYLGPVGKDQSVNEDTEDLGGLRFFLDVPSACGSVDLYSDLCSDEVLWGGLGTRVSNDSFNKPSGQAGSFAKTRNGDLTTNLHSSINGRTSVKHLLQNENYEVYYTKNGAMSKTAPLHVPAKETEKETYIDDNSNPASASELQQMLDSSEKDFEGLKLLKKKVDSDDSESDDGSFSSSYSISEKHELDSRRRKKDLLLVHLLHLACSSNGTFSHGLPEISLELYNLGMISEWAKVLSRSPSTFSKVFGHAFEHQMNASRISQFWKFTSNFNGDNRSSLPKSRYLNDFEEIHFLGRGGFGHVVLCKNKLDGRHYAVKKIRLKDRNPHVNEKILREVATLSRLQHQHVVRYYQAWVEADSSNYHGETTCGSMTAESFTGSFLDASVTSASVPDNRLESTYLYIQMEYCPRTLRQDFETYSASVDKDNTWHLFRQIVEGLAHIHSQGIIHRDLTPSNIFFDTCNEIKIGDFGLAKFLKLEQLDHDHYFPNETNEVSIDGTGQVGTYFYTAPEIEQRWPQINEKVDMYSLGVVFFELWHPFTTVMERHIILSDLKQKRLLPNSWIEKLPKQSAILQRLMSPSPADRPSATDLLHQDLPPRMEDEWLNDVVRTLQSSDDSYVYDRIVSSIFDTKGLVMKAHHQHNRSSKLIRDEPSFLQYTELDTELQDNAIEITKEIFRQHGAKRLEISPMRILDDEPMNRNTVKLLTSGGDMLELCHELRTPYVNWVVANQVFSFKRYEINRVYRRAVGHSTPNRFYQGDFDIIGGSSPLMEAEAIKVVVDIASRFHHPSTIDIRLNHAQVLEKIWSWAGVSKELRQNVAELLSLFGSSPPHSTKRKTNWAFVRRQLLQDLHLSEVVVDRFQTADLRFCGSVDNALARMRGALFPDKFVRKALEEISSLVSYLRTWNIEKNVSVDVLMPPTEEYFRGLYFQIFINDPGQVQMSEATLMATGGCYDYFIHQKWNHENRSTPPGAVGISLALEKLFRHCSIDMKPSRIEPNIYVLVCSKGGGGLLLERMELVEELWQANMKAEFVLLSDPTLTEQYEYAAEHDIKCLIIITEASLTQSGLVKIRHLELKREKNIERGKIIKFLTDAASTQFRNLSIWN